MTRLITTLVALATGQKSHVSMHFCHACIHLSIIIRKCLVKQNCSIALLLSRFHNDGNYHFSFLHASAHRQLDLKAVFIMIKSVYMGLKQCPGISAALKGNKSYRILRLLTGEQRWKWWSLCVEKLIYHHCGLKLSVLKLEFSRLVGSGWKW